MRPPITGNTHQVYDALTAAAKQRHICGSLGIWGVDMDVGLVGPTLIAGRSLYNCSTMFSDGL